MEEMKEKIAKLRTLLEEKEMKALNSEDVSSYAIGAIENIGKRINYFERMYFYRNRNPFYEKQILTNFINEGNQIEEAIEKIRLYY